MNIFPFDIKDFLHRKATKYGEQVACFYCPQDKLWEGNVFTCVCLFTGGLGMSGPRSLPGLPASFTPTSDGFVEGKSLLVVFGFYFFQTPPSGPPWNEGHRPRVRHETSVLEVLALGTT